MMCIKNKTGPIFQKYCKVGENETTCDPYFNEHEAYTKPGIPGLASDVFKGKLSVSRLFQGWYFFYCCSQGSLLLPIWNYLPLAFVGSHSVKNVCFAVDTSLLGFGEKMFKWVSNPKSLTPVGLKLTKNLNIACKEAIQWHTEGWWFYQCACWHINKCMIGFPGSSCIWTILCWHNLKHIKIKRNKLAFESWSVVCDICSLSSLVIARNLIL